jgi:hypothetical protein
MLRIFINVIGLDVIGMALLSLITTLETGLQFGWLPSSHWAVKAQGGSILL